MGCASILALVARRAPVRRLASVLVLALGLAACGGSDEPAGGAVAPATITSITVTPSGAILGVGLTTTVSAEARDQNGALMAGVDFTWASSNAGVGSVAGGVATGVAAGTTRITASSGGVRSNEALLTVVAPLSRSRVVVDKAGVFLTAAGATAQLTAQPFDAAGAPLAGPVTWSSSAPDKVSVDAGGQVVALAVGSAQIFAESAGVRSAPTLVVVARPQAGAVLVSDTQVVSVGPPLSVPAGESAGVGTQYEVVLHDVAAPVPGTVLLAAETAPVAGRVVAVRQDASGLVVTLALAPLYELFEAYDIRLSIALAAFEFEEVPERGALAGPRALWGAGSARPRALGAMRPLDAFEPFRAFKCDASLEPQLIGKAIQLSLENKLNLVLEDRPGHSKHALEGSVDIVGNAGLKLKAGFKAKGDCKAQGQIKLPVFGWFSALVMPAVRLGVGAELEGEILLVQGELGVEGKVGFAGVLGWECGGAVPACRGLDEISPKYDLKTRSKIPSANDVQAKVSGHFYVVAGLDAAVLFGTLNAEILEARIGPKQSFDLGFEDDQAARPDYASSYDLKLEGVVEPGAALQKAIKAVVNDSATGVTFDAKFNLDLSESPKGTLAIDKAKVRPKETVTFSVDLDPKTVSYFLLGYNVTRVDLYRKREDETKFTPWKAMDLIATHKASYRWTPETADAGKYEFAAFVNTDQNIPVPLLEVKLNSIQPLEVSCFGGPPAMQGAPRMQALGQRVRLDTVCADSWAGTASLVARTPGTPPEDNITATANIVWTFDRVDPGGNIVYKASGSFELAFNFTSTGCTTTLAPNRFEITSGPDSQSSLIISPKNPLIPQTYFIRGRQLVDFTATTVCPGEPTKVSEVKGYLADFATGTGPYTEQTTLSGSYEDLQFTYAWNFSRP